MTRDWHRILDEGGSVLCVFLDLAKAFDSIPHRRIMAALWDAGVRDPLFSWFHSYLSGRKQFVVLGDASSDMVQVSSGVPQGSILGPLLFLLAFNPIFSVPRSSRSSLVGYADDLTYHKAIFEDEDLEEARRDLDELSGWIAREGFRLQTAKTKCMVISRKRSPPAPVIMMGGVQLEQVSRFKLLGVTVSEDLSWAPHVATTCVRAKRLLGCVYRTFGLACKNALSRIYRGVVRPILDYASSVWDPYHAVHRVRLERVQSFAAKIVCKCWQGSATELREGLGWPTLQSRREYQKLCVCRRILCGESLIPASCFIPHPRPCRNHRNSRPLYTPRVRTEQHRSSYFISVVPAWNSIPESVAACQSQLGFKRSLFKLFYP